MSPDAAGKTAAEHDFRRVGKLLVVQAVRTAKVGQSTFGRHTGATEKHTILGVVDHGLQSGYLIIKDNFGIQITPFLRNKQTRYLYTTIF